MATAFGTTAEHALIPLIPKIKEEERHEVTLTRMVGGDKRKHKVPLVMTEDVESLLRLVRDFMDATAQERLSLTTGPLKFSFFRQCLADNVRDEWDVVRAGVNETNINFELTIEEFIGRYILPTDLEDQKQYLDRVSKPFKLNVTALSGRLRFINQLMRYFPGANDTPPYDERGLKTLFFRMMLPEWKENFVSSGTELTDNDYTYQNLVRYMVAQETAYNRKKVRERINQVRGRTGRGGRHSPGRKREAAGNQGGRAIQRARTGGNCPFHGYHDWADCYGNPHSANYRPDYRLVAAPGGRGRNAGRGRSAGRAGRGGRGGRGRGRPRVEAYHADDVEFHDEYVPDVAGTSGEADENEEETSGEVHWADELVQPDGEY